MPRAKNEEIVGHKCTENDICFVMYQGCFIDSLEMTELSVIFFLAGRATIFCTTGNLAIFDGAASILLNLPILAQIWSSCSYLVCYVFTDLVLASLSMFFYLLINWAESGTRTGIAYITSNTGLRAHPLNPWLEMRSFARVNRIVHQWVVGVQLMLIFVFFLRAGDHV